MKKRPARKPAGPSGPKDFLLEIGVEELPARFVLNLVSRSAIGEGASVLEDVLVRQGLAKAGLSHGEVKVFGTPRRLAVLVHGLADKAEDQVHEALGPAAAQAKDAEGNWTPAAQGFARSQGVSPENLEVRKTDRGERLCAVRREEGRPVEKILPELLPARIARIPFPKNMVWEEGRFSFARPIRWIVALYGDKPVKFELAGVKSGRKTSALRFHGKKFLDVPSPARYEAVLKNHCVVADPKERRDQIEKQIHLAAKSVHGRVPLEKFQDLLDEVTYLVEHPSGILGRFAPGHLKLPPEILVTSMKKHQKFFPVFDAQGKLLPHFVGVRNGMSENQAVVREGYERVLAARLADAAFFFEQDRKTSLRDKAPLLKGVLFQKALGALSDKTERVAALCIHLSANVLNLPQKDGDAAVQIARLGKADLVTSVVGEFPELQGVMGRLYAAADGEPAEIAEGIEQHYWPLTADGELPRGDAAALASLADKLDTLAGDFLVGLIPSGSADPYGLRRAAVGVLRILADRGWRLDLAAAVEKALAAFPDSVAGDRPKAAGALMDFFKQRWSALMAAKGCRFDEIEAVASLRFADVVDAENRLEALRQIRRHPDFTPLAVAYKRAANILSQARQKNIAFNVPAAPLEKSREPAHADLHAAVEAARGAAHPLLEGGRFREALQELVRLRAPVDRFFEKVMVMAPEEDVRANRLALLNSIAELFLRVADFSALQDVPSGAAPDGPAAR
ncbi:MAG: glycine--tRNA ligase subunit beta [Elusimicrobiota bacterium]